MQRKCPYCGEYFRPNPKLKSRQKTCGKEKCRREHRRKYQKKWWSKNKRIYNPRYSDTKGRPSRDPETRSSYRQQPQVREKHAACMRRWRQKKRLEQGKSVRCTNTDIELMPHQKRELPLPKISVSVRCTDTDILVSLMNTGRCAAKNKSLWSVRCTKLDGFYGKRVLRF